MAPLDPALTVAQQRMNTQAGAKRRRGPAAKQPGSAPKQRCVCTTRLATCSCYACNPRRHPDQSSGIEAHTAIWTGPSRQHVSSSHGRVPREKFCCQCRAKVKRSKPKSRGADDSGALAEAELTALEADISQLQVGRLPLLFLAYSILLTFGPEDAWESCVRASLDPLVEVAVSTHLEGESAG